uniref:beta-N-acetylhexosaminidase n=1 Tax=alpha proteobacterium NT18-17 TaxID=1778876 RepID=A0A126QG76_9PROT|nr:beta-hexosaminidase [alpha proteobacterium NT18-17]
MASDWYGYVVESEWTSTDLGWGTSSYRITLINRTEQPLAGFRLGMSGPALVVKDEPVTNWSIVYKLSNYCEIAPPPGLVLAPGESWTASVALSFPLKHWTDGAVTAMVVTSDGKAHAALTRPAGNAGSTMPLKRGVMPMPVAVPGVAPYAIVPWPNAVAASGNRTAPSGFDIGGHDGVAGRFADLVDHLFPGEGLVRDAAEGGYPVALELGGDFAAEAYALGFAADRASVRAATETGLLYGLITLGQMLRGARLHPQSFTFPTAGAITDAPGLGWRGCHFDVSRQFFSSAEVRQFLRTMAWNKLNRFHWHLSDDESWRVEIDAYPELTSKAAWRGHGMTIPPLLGSGPERSGGYYTKDVVRQIVALAQGLGIETVPEIDVPGHCYALIQTISALRDQGENGQYFSIQFFDNNSLNPSLDKVYAVIQTIFAELIELFPAPWFHVGADEVPHDAWDSSPQAQALMGKVGGTEARNLQAYFLQRLQAWLTSMGKVTGAWEEASEGGGIDKANSYLVGWRNVEANQRLAGEGYDVVVAPAQRYYLDMANGPDWHEPGASWAGWSSPEMTYAFVPDAGWSDAERAHLIGIQGAIWCEPMTERGAFDRLVYPRLSAIAETGWTRAENKSWARFKGSVGLMPSLYGMKE